MRLQWPVLLCGVSITIPSFPERQEDVAISLLEATRIATSSSDHKEKETKSFRASLGPQ